MRDCGCSRIRFGPGWAVLPRCRRPEPGVGRIALRPMAGPGQQQQPASPPPPGVSQARRWSQPTRTVAWGAMASLSTPGRSSTGSSAQAASCSTSVAGTRPRCEAAGRMAGWGAEVLECWSSGSSRSQPEIETREQSARHISATPWTRHLESTREPQPGPERHGDPLPSGQGSEALKEWSARLQPRATDSQIATQSHGSASTALINLMQK